MQLLDTLDDAMRPFMQMVRYEKGGLFSKAVRLDYKGISNQPWLSFRCLTDDAYSFNIHDLQMPDEFIYWHGAAKREKTMTFEGHVNHLYRRGIGALRGYMKVDDDPWKLGVYVINGKLIDVLTEKQRTKNMESFMAMIMHYTDDFPPDDAA